VLPTLLFPYGGEIFFGGFIDSDYRDCIDSRRSVSGHLFKLGNSTISWQSQKQTTVFTSITEAQYVALSKATNHFLWLKTTLKDLQFPDTPIALYCNNRSSIDLTENHQIAELAKYIDIYHHLVRELVDDQTLLFLYI
jgi:hypothetical protein